MDYEKEYQDACVRPTDMHEHLPWISELTSEWQLVERRTNCNGMTLIKRVL
jgi:hypothetical protein